MNWKQHRQFRVNTVCHLHKYNEKRTLLQEMQTLPTRCSKAEPNIFAPPQTPFPGAWDDQNFIS